MTRSSLKDFNSIILVAHYDITRRGKVGRKSDISEKKKRPEHQQAYGAREVTFHSFYYCVLSQY